ncbi:TetR/AcrR family transcriptional regulator [Aldersonia sp. NBC_00410]|uniref:TetR/AcrR family transcriptional regulator n=1 Tax=Aldersonia sp. NBC_00410 TaxID=2975954 RepID=UPI00225394A2|nr:TetR/AcrR family transcriptional regulator [Aldersonia sp. NBC_00410]MCX5043523.1 TetR/AcrR family transcriptional regulator [Aldersonia sp. NBC_00410]
MAPARTRRTQAERTDATRRLLLDATFESLVEAGFKGTTTTAVAHRAGVSMGALLHHFPTKADLLTAAVVHSFDRRIEEFGLLMAGLDAAADKLDAAIDLLWSMYSRPTLTAWHELWVAARTDPALAAAVIEIDRQFMAASQRVYVELFPVDESAHSPSDHGIGLHVIYALLDGLATSRSIDGYEPHPTEAVLNLFKTMLRLTLAQSDTGTKESQ